MNLHIHTLTPTFQTAPTNFQFLTWRYTQIILAHIKIETFTFRAIVTVKQKKNKTKNRVIIETFGKQWFGLLKCDITHLSRNSTQTLSLVL
jgi:hypothetical protein